MSNIVVDNAYFDWLCDRIDYIPGVDGEYDILLGTLHSVPFTWSVSHDENRAADGLNLREMFMDDEDWHSEPLIGEPCSVLEMMIGLAIRIENDIMWDGETDRTHEWFWIMVANLGLDRYDNDNYSSEDVNYIVDKMLRRTYEKNGEGGCFPLACCFRDQRKVELWNQMQSFLMENYDF